MNCFNHPAEMAVSSCPDCGKGLCRECTGLYEVPICSSCNLKRVQNDKGINKKAIILSVVLLMVGFNFGTAMTIREGIAAIGSGIFGAILFAGVPWGWKCITFIQPKMFLFLSFFGWFMYFAIKLSLSAAIGFIACPILIFRLIREKREIQMKEETVNQNLKNNS